VIIPGRNVGGWVGRCLSSVLGQRGVRPEVVFVDDDSEDETGRVVVGRFVGEGVRYVRVGASPAGWIGKNWACWRGFHNSTSEWLLFLDADSTFLDDCVLADALRACYDGVDVLSLIPRLDASKTPSKVMLPLLQNIFWALFNPARTNDSSSHVAILFGAFILVRRGVYEAVGGHAAVHGRLLEDRALASLFKGSGYRVRLLDGSERFTAEFAGTLKGYVEAIRRLVADYAKTHSLAPLRLYIALSVLHLLIPQLILVITLLHGSTFTAMISSLSVGLNVVANTLELRRLRVGAGPLYAPLTLIANWVLVWGLVSAYASSRSGKIEVKWRGRLIRNT